MGLNTFGQIGDAFASGAGQGYTAVPTAVAGGLTFVQIEAGARHSCGLTAAGKAYCWGDNSSWEAIGASTTGGLQNVPAPVATNVLFKSLSAGSMITCGIARTGGGMYCWGSNFAGALGIGAPSNNEPVSDVAPPQP